MELVLANGRGREPNLVGGVYLAIFVLVFTSLLHGHEYNVLRNLVVST